MSWSLSVFDTLVMFPASFVRCGLEVPQLLDDVFVVLACHARNLVLSGESAEVAHRAQRLVGFGLAAHGTGGVGLEGRRADFCAAK